MKSYFDTHTYIFSVSCTNMPYNCNSTYIGPSLAKTFSPLPQAILFMSILNDFLLKRSDITQMCLRIVPKQVPLDSYDFIVIGGGASGAAAAGRLGKLTRYQTLLLEAGDDEPPALSVPSFAYNFNSYKNAVNWNFRTEETNACLAFNKSCTYPRGKCLGGTTAINGMMYMRGTRQDYDQWEVQGNQGWGFKDLTPTFFKFEDNLEVGSLVRKEYHGIGGTLPVTRFPYHPPIAEDILAAAAESGFGVSQDLNGQQLTGYAIAQTNSRLGTRFSSARAYVRPLRYNKNFHVMLNSTATKILVSTDGTTKRATGVAFIYNGQKFTVSAKKAIILSAGTFKSPQLLLLSGIGSKDILDQYKISPVLNLPGVGRNLHNHVALQLNYIMGTTKAVLDLDWTGVLNYFLYRTGPMSSTGISQVTARLSSKFTNSSNPDIQVFFGGIIANGSYTGAIEELQYLNNPGAKKVLSISPVYLHTRSRGYVTLKSRDPLTDPLIHGNYLTVQQDIEGLLQGVRLVHKLVSSKALGQKYNMSLDPKIYPLCGHFKFDTDEYWRCCIRYYTAPENHSGGTCRMGPKSDSMAVVDSKLEVHGLEDLYVMDASIMPAMVSGNPVATCVLIAEKGVDGIERKYRLLQ